MSDHDWAVAAIPAMFGIVGLLMILVPVIGCILGSIGQNWKEKQ